jgi:F0F1-type ATP synthase assembly protein I
VWAGTTPWFMIALTVFGTVGQFVKMYFTYSARMRTLEQARADAVRSAGR